MVNIEKLVPKIKIKEIPKGTEIKIKTNDWIISVNRPEDEVTITIEYIGPGPDWGIMKVSYVKTDMDLQDLVASVVAWLMNLINQPQSQPQSP